jgi:hypothetical protein
MCSSMKEENIWVSRKEERKGKWDCTCSDRKET